MANSRRQERVTEEELSGLSPAGLKSLKGLLGQMEMLLALK